MPEVDGLHVVVGDFFEFRDRGFDSLLGAGRNLLEVLVGFFF